MKKRLLSILVLMGILLLFACGQVDNNNGPSTNQMFMRSADPCEVWKRWQTGPAAVITPELRDGKASHMRPAEIIFYSVRENPTNPVTVLTRLQNKGLLNSGFAAFWVIDLRMFEGMDYDLEGGKYPGFYPQTVAWTYQLWINNKKDIPFEKTLEDFQFLYGPEAFKESYAKYAQLMNELCGTSFDLYPSSEGYYTDFYGAVDIEKIQQFLERLDSPLKNDLFNQFPNADNLVDYSDAKTCCK